MSLLSLFALAIALAVDSFAAAVAKGSRMPRPTLRQGLAVAAVFAIVQVLMPLFGWQLGIEMKPVIERFDHWVAFVILFAIGMKMIIDGVRGVNPAGSRPGLTFWALVLTAVATSIDALVVGLGFGVLNLSVLIALFMIGSVTFAVSLAGVTLGRMVHQKTEDYIEILGGLALIAIGARILFDHLSAG
jgi:putative Mn2+ efflux pump MntP